MSMPIMHPEIQNNVRLLVAITPARVTIQRTMTQVRVFLGPKWSVRMPHKAEPITAEGMTTMKNWFASARVNPITAWV